MKTIIKKTLTFELLQDNKTWNITYTSGNLTISVQADTDYISNAIGKEVGNITLTDIEPLKAYIEADKAGVAIVTTVTTSVSKKETFKNIDRDIDITVEDDVFCTMVAGDGRTYTGAIRDVIRVIWHCETGLELMQMWDFDALLEWQEKKSQVV